MISPWIAKVANALPESWFRAISSKVIRGYINKYAKINIEGLEKIKNIEGPKIFICNHLSNSDGLVLNQVLKEYDPYFVAGIKLSNDPVTKMGTKVVKTINIKPNSADKEAITNIVKTIKKGHNLMIFPEGTRSRVGKMIEAKKGIVLIARLTKATIIPIGMHGTEKLLPINTVGDMSKEQWHEAEVNIKIGNPMTLPKKDKEEGKHNYDDRCLMTMMKGISNLLPKSYRGFYK